MECSIVTPSKKFFDGEIEYISAPGKVGEFGVLPGHENFVTVLDVGIIDIKPEGKERFKLLVEGGYFEITEDKIFLIADDIITEDDVNIEDAKQMIQRYKNELSSLNFGDANYVRVQKKVKKYEKMLELVS